MRHALGILGVLAAGVLLAVSAAMNWQFGFSLGKTEFDGQIYGAASAAADCLKALIPFFLFAAVRNRMWSQAAASAVVWVVVTAYSLTSALGHAALNRLDTAGQRAQQTAVYQDMRSDIKRMESQVSWIPQHRPAATVASEMDGLRNQLAWKRTKECTSVAGKFNRDFCQQFHTLSAEHANGIQAAHLSKKIMEVKAELAKAGEGGATALTEADPQAAMLAKIGNLVFADVKVDDVQMALTIFIALLLEVGSSFGMYIAFSQWRLHDSLAIPAAAKAAAVGHAAVPAPAEVPVAANDVPAPLPVVQREVEEEAEVAISKTPAAIVEAPAAVEEDLDDLPAGGPAHVIATAPALNDNIHKAVAIAPRAPESDVERFQKERIETADGSRIAGADLYKEYREWCLELEKKPLARSVFTGGLRELKGVKTERAAGKLYFLDVAVLRTAKTTEDKKSPVPITRAA